MPSKVSRTYIYIYIALNVILILRDIQRYRCCRQSKVTLVSVIFEQTSTSVRVWVGADVVINIAKPQNKFQSLDEVKRTFKLNQQILEKLNLLQRRKPRDWVILSHRHP